MSDPRMLPGYMRFCLQRNQELILAGVTNFIHRQRIYLTEWGSLSKDQKAEWMIPHEDALAATLLVDIRHRSILQHAEGRTPSA